MGAISFYLEDVNPVKVKRRELKNFFRTLIEMEGFSFDVISIIFCSDMFLVGMNRKYLKHNYLTDIITFDYTKDGIISGELYISTERVRENAIEYKVEFKNELLRVMIHGFLHLMGYKDKAAEEKLLMRKKEDFYMDMFLSKV